MLPTYLLARDHLERAASILEQDTDGRTRQLRLVIVRTLDLLTEFERHDRQKARNVVDFQAFRFARTQERHTPRSR